MPQLSINSFDIFMSHKKWIRSFEKKVDLYK